VYKNITFIHNLTFISKCSSIFFEKSKYYLKDDAIKIVYKQRWVKVEYKKEIKCYFTSYFIKKNKTVYLRIVVTDLQNVIYKNKRRFKKRDGGLAKDACINKVFRLINKLELTEILSSNNKIEIYCNNKILVKQVLNDEKTSIRRQRRDRVQYLTNVLNSHDNWKLLYDTETNTILKRIYSNGVKKKQNLLKKKQMEIKKCKKQIITRKINDLINEKTTNIVFFDLEMNCTDKTKDNLGYWETISIGAVKYNIKRNTIERFYSLIKPQFNAVLSNKCMELTNIEQNEINNANKFREVFTKLEQWIKGQKSIFVSWGAEDIRTIKKENKINGFRLRIVNEMLNNYIDFQSEFCLDYIKTRQVISLTNALKDMGREFDGRKHNALNDAFNLYRVYKAYVVKEEK